ncbi:MAG: murein biosynthesis integral membrane protein MurJ [bacterium]
MKGLLLRLNNSDGRSVLVIAICSLLSRVLGLLRDRALAHVFGTGSVLDAYVAAFRIPDFIFNTLILGALGAAFIPVFIKAREDSKELANQVSSDTLRFLLLVATALAVIMWIFAPWAVKYIAPGFDEQTLKLTLNLTRIMLLTIPLFTVSNVLSGVLNASRKYVSYALAPIFYNLGILFGVLALYPLIGTSGLAYGIVLGAFFHGVIQLPETIITGWRYVASGWLLPETRRILKLMIPRMIGLGVNQINQVVVTSIATTVGTGAVSVFYFANNIQALPIGLIAVSFSIVAFPLLASAHAKGEKELFLNHFSLNFRRIIFWIIPAAMLLLVLRAQVVRILLGSGEFNWNDTYLTAQSLGIFTLSLLPQALYPLVARTFYAQGDTKRPLYFSLATVGLQIVLSLWLGQLYGVIGLAASFSLAQTIGFVLLLWSLHQRLGGLDDLKLIRSLLRVSGVSLLAAGASYGMLYLVAPLVNMRTAVGILLQGGLAGLAGVLMYFIVHWIMKSEEMVVAREWWVKRGGKFI